MNKYHNKKVTYNGLVFDSKHEAERWAELCWLRKANKIACLKRQVKFVLQDSFKKNGKTIRESAYIADFVYYDKETGQVVVEDAKGMKTDVYKIKKKMFEKRYPELTIKEV